MVRTRKCYCRSTWNIRNGSSNVAAILNPESHIFLDNNTCYCREKAIKPQLFLRPKKCIFTEDDDESDGFRRRLPRTPRVCDQFEYTLPKFKKVAGKESSDARRLHLPSKEISSSYQNGVETQDSGQVVLYEKNKSKPSHSSFKIANSENVVQSRHTFTRDNDKLIDNFDNTTDFQKAAQSRDQDEETSTYDYYKKTNFEDSSSESLSLFKKQFDDIDYSDEYKDAESADNVVVNRQFDSVHSKGRYHPSTSQHRTKNTEEEGEYEGLSKNYSDLHLKDYKNTQSKLKQLSDFRKDHYFDTHSTEDLIKTVPEHICVHRFELDDRFLPQALNADAYGESRCIICGRVMERSPVNKVDERFVKNKKLFPKFYKYGLAPKKIYLGDDKNVKLEMVLRDKQLGVWEYKSQKPNYCNTYALRYQKGVV